MAGEYCRWATCGHCGHCDAEPEYRFECLWCGDEAREPDDEYWPYCSPLCAARAETDSLEDQP